jgi:signal transduction histidine kinase
MIAAKNAAQPVLECAEPEAAGGVRAAGPEAPARRRLSSLPLFGRFSGGSLRRALVLRITLLGLAPVLIMAFVAINLSNQLLYARFAEGAHELAAAAQNDLLEQETAATQLASLLAILPSLRQQMAQGDQEELTRYLLSIKSRTKAEILDVADLDGYILAGAQDVPPGARLPDTLLRRAGASAQQAWAIYDEPDGVIIRAIALVRGPNGEALGMVEVGELVGKDFIQKLKSDSNQDVALIWNGRVRLSSVGPDADVFPSLAEVDEAPNDELTRQVRVNGTNYLGIFSVVRTHTDDPGILAVLVPTTPIEDATRNLLIALSVLTVLLAVVLMVLAHSSSAAVIEPLREVDAAAKRIQMGDLAARVPPQYTEEMRTLAETFNTMAEALAGRERELLRLDEMKSSFISNASHELRTPLASIRSFSEVLVEDELDPETRKEFAGIINSEAERLSRLVNDVLDISRIEANAVEWNLAPCDLAAELNTLIVSQQPVAQAKGLELLLDCPAGLPLVIADHDGLHQVLLNLVGNAIKFTATGRVTVSAAPHGQFVEVAVTDTGPGISQDDGAHIFERFYQGGNTLTEKPNGTGLGLAICQKILEHHGSEIRLQSELDKGSRFSFELPVAAVAMGEAPSELITTPSGGRV